MGKFKGLVHITTKFLVKHAPEILTAIGITGMITTTVLAVKSTPDAMVDIENDSRRNHDGDPYAYTKVEAVKSAWKHYIPAMSSGVLSTICLISANSMHLKRNVAIATAYRLSEAAFSEYRDSVIDVIGERKEKAIRNKVSEKEIKDNPLNESVVLISKKGETLCYDPIFKRYFKSDWDFIERTAVKLNKRILKDPFNSGVSVNDFYYELGLDDIDSGNDIGWNLDNDLSVSPSAQLADDGVTPCIVIQYENYPVYNFCC